MTLRADQEVRRMYSPVLHNFKNLRQALQHYLPEWDEPCCELEHKIIEDIEHRAHLAQVEVELKVAKA